MFGEQGPVPLILTARFALEANEVEEGVDRSADEHFHGLVGAASPVSLAPRPAFFEDLFDNGGFELEGDEVLRRAVKDGIVSDEESFAGADTDKQCGVETVRVLPQMVDIPR